MVHSQIDIKSICKTSWVQSAFKTEFNVKTVEQTYSISKNHKKCCLFNRKCINDFLAKGYSFFAYWLGSSCCPTLFKRVCCM